MTANWPWYAISPAGVLVCAGHGRGWRYVVDARAAVLDVIAGTRVVSFELDSKCGDVNFGRAVVKCYACDGGAAGYARPAGDPSIPIAPACNRHRWADLPAHTEQGC